VAGEEHARRRRLHSKQPGQTRAAAASFSLQEQQNKGTLGVVVPKPRKKGNAEMKSTGREGAKGNAGFFVWSSTIRRKTKP
jgi:hypothetical protein